MPLKKCTLKGKSGWSWGNAKCFVGKDAKLRAIKMGIAIEGPEKFKQIMKSGKGQFVSELELTEAIQFIEEHCDEESPWEELCETNYIEAAQAYISKKVRDEIPKEDFGDPENRKYPIRNQSDLDAAVKLIGRAPQAKQSSIKSNIKKIAKRKNLKLPETWN